MDFLNIQDDAQLVYITETKHVVKNLTTDITFTAFHSYTRSVKRSIDSIICSKVSTGIPAMRRVKPFVPLPTLKMPYNAVVQPYFEYCRDIALRDIAELDHCGMPQRPVTKISK